MNLRRILQGEDTFAHGSFVLLLWRDVRTLGGGSASVSHRERSRGNDMYEGPPTCEIVLLSCTLWYM